MNKWEFAEEINCTDKELLNIWNLWRNQGEKYFSVYSVSR